MLSGASKRGAGAGDRAEGPGAGEKEKSRREESLLSSAAAGSAEERKSHSTLVDPSFANRGDSERMEQLSSDKRKRETSDRAAALSAFREKSGASGGGELAADLSAFKRSSGGAPRASSQHALGGAAADRRRREAGEKQIELRVDFQRFNPNKNLNWFKDGEERSIGGPASGADYMITTIPVEGVIAKIRRSGDIFIFESLDKSYFPEHHVHEGENILNKRVKLRSPATEQVSNFSLREYLPSKERINRYLHMVDEPGSPKDDFEPDEF